MANTDYASIVSLICSFIDELRPHDDKQIVVHIPVVIPDRVRYRFLHNQIDLVLFSALRSRPDVGVARVQLPLEGLATESGAIETVPTSAVTTDTAAETPG